MRLTVVGCSGSLPGPDSAASCYLLEADDPQTNKTFRLVLDLGSGAIGALQKYADLKTIDAVAFTHLHADHCLDLCGFYVVRKFQHDGPPTRVPVYGPPGTGERMARAYDMAPHPGMSAQFDFREYDGTPLDIGPFRLETTRVDHPVDAYALRLRCNGSTLVYSGDTGPCSELEAAAAGADLLLAEASFVEDDDNPDHLHLTGRDAATIATKAGARRLVLTHIPPWIDPQQVLAEARPHFDGPLHLATPGLSFTL